MNEEAVEMLYSMFKDNGYTDTPEDFKALIESNEDAVKMGFNMFKDNGYPDREEDFYGLIGFKKKVQESPTTESLSEDGSLELQESEEVQLQPENSDYTIETIEDGEADPIAASPTSVPLNFKAKGELPVEGEVPVEDQNPLKGTLLSEESLGADKFEGSLNSIDSDFIASQKEEFAVPELNYKFGQYGFTFEEGYGGVPGINTGDAMEVTALNGEKININLDPAFGIGSESEANDLKKFLQDNREESEKLYAQIQNAAEKVDVVQNEEEILNTVKVFNKMTSDYQKEVKDFATKAQAHKKEYDMYFANLSAEDIKNNPLIKEAYDSYLQEDKIIRQQYGSLLEQEELFKERGATLDKIAGDYFSMRSKQGETIGAMGRAVIQGSARAGATLANTVIDIGTGLASFRTISEQTAYKDLFIKHAIESNVDLPEGYKDMDIDTITESMDDKDVDAIEEIVEEKEYDKAVKELKYGKPSFRNPYSTRATATDLDKGIVEMVRETLPQVVGGNLATKHYMAMEQQKFWAGSLIGMAESLPAMVSAIGAPGGVAGWVTRTAMMYGQVADHVNEEMEKNPEFQNISEAEKYFVSAPIGIAVGALEAIGFRNVIAQKGLLNGVVARALRKSTSKTTAKSFSEFIKQDVESMVGRGLLTVTAGGLAEFETGLTQEFADVGIKKIYNEAKGKDMFQMPDTWQDLTYQALRAGAQELVGGMVMGTPGAVVTAVTGGKMSEAPNVALEILQEYLKDSNYGQIYESKLEQQVQAGEITRKEADKQKSEFNNILSVVREVTPDLSSNRQKTAIELLYQKKKLEREIENLAPELATKRKERIENIKKDLQVLEQEQLEEDIKQKESERGISEFQQEATEKVESEITEEEQGDVDAFFGSETESTTDNVTGNLSINRKGETKLFGAQKDLRNSIVNAAKLGAKAISKVLPKTKMVLHETNEEYLKYVGREGRGEYNPTDNVIHINLSNATKSTVAHEIFHAVFIDKVKTDQKAAEFAEKMMKSVRKTLSNDSALAKSIDEFAAKYTGEQSMLQNEERLAELMGILASDNKFKQLSKPAKNVIVDFFKRLARKFGIKLGEDFGKTDESVIDLMNTLSRKTRMGEVITQEDVQSIEVKGEPKVTPETKTEVEVTPEVVEEVTPEIVEPEVKEEVPIISIDEIDSHMESVEKEIEAYDKEFAENKTGRKDLTEDEVLDIVAESIKDGTYKEPKKLYDKRDKPYLDLIQRKRNRVKEVLGKLNPIGVLEVLGLSESVDIVSIVDDLLKSIGKKIASKDRDFSERLQNQVGEALAESRDLSFEGIMGPDSGLSANQKKQFLNEVQKISSDLINVLTTDETTTTQEAPAVKVAPKKKPAAKKKPTPKKETKEEKTEERKVLFDSRNIKPRQDKGTETTTIQEEDLEQGGPGEVGTIKMPRQRVIDAPDVKNDPRSWVRDLVEMVSVETLEGRNFITNMYDYTIAGIVDLGNGFSIELLGGRNYVPYIMKKLGKKLEDVSNLAAFNTKAQAETFIRNAIEGKANLFAPHSGTLTDSWQFQQHIFASLVDLVLDNNILTNEDLIKSFNAGLVRTEDQLNKLKKEYKKNIKAFNKNGFYLNKKGRKITKEPIEPTKKIEPFKKFLQKYQETKGLPPLKNTDNLNDFLNNPKELVRLLDIENNISPDLRKRLNQKIITNNKFKKAIGTSKVEDFYDKIIDPLNKGVVGGEIMTFVQFDPSTFEIVKTKPGDLDHHPSFGWSVKAKIEKILQPTKFYKSYDVTDSYTKFNADETVVSRKADLSKKDFESSNVSSSAGAIPKKATVVSEQELLSRQQKSFENKTMDEVIDIGRDNNLKDAQIRDYLIRTRKLKAKTVDEALSIQSDLFKKLPKSFRNVIGGAKAGAVLFNKVNKFREKLIKSNEKRTKLTKTELGKKVSEFRAEQKKTYKTNEQIKEEVDKFRESTKNRKRKTPLTEAELDDRVQNKKKQLEEQRDKQKEIADKKIAAFKKSETSKNNKRKAKLTPQQIVDATIEFLEEQAEYKAESVFFTTGSKKEGTQKVEARKGMSVMQARLASELQKSIQEEEGIGSTVEMAAKIRDARVMIRTIKGAQKDLNNTKRQLRNFIRKTIPATLYTKPEVINLIRKVAEADETNINNLITEVENFAIEKNVEILEKNINNILEGKYTKVEFGRLKANKISSEVKTQIEEIAKEVLAKEENAEKIVEKIDELRTKFSEISQKAELDQSDFLNLVKYEIAINLNNALLFTNTEVGKVEALEEANNYLMDLLSMGRSQLQQQINEQTKKNKENQGIAYEEITGKKIDFNNPESNKELKKFGATVEGRRQIKDTQNVIKRAVRQILDFPTKMFVYQEALGGLMDKISSLPGEMFGGKLQDVVTGKVNESSIRYKERMLEGQERINNKLEEIYGKKWKKEIDKNKQITTEIYRDKEAVEQAKKAYKDNPSVKNKAKLKDVIAANKTEIYRDKEAVEQAQEEYKNNPSVETKTKLDDAIAGNIQILTQNQMYYWYNQYKDPANHPSFGEMFFLEVINNNDDAAERKRKRDVNDANAKRVMDEIESAMTKEVKAFADWQVNEYFPELYPVYNETYQKIYRTNMPWNEKYAGRIYRKGVEPEALDLLGNGGTYSTSVGASSSKVRVQTTTPIEKMDGTDALVSYVRDMEYFAAYAETIRDIHSMFSNQYVKGAIEAIHGEYVNTLIKNQIDNIASKGIRSEREAKWINAMNNVFVVGRIALSPVIYIKQLISTFTYANDIGYANWIKYSVKNKAQLIKVYKEVRDNSVYMRDRKNKGILRALEAYSDTKVVKFLNNRRLNWFTDALMFFAKTGDRTAIFLGGLPNYSYYKDQAIKKGYTEEEAIKIAITKFEKDTKDTQQSSDLQDKDIFQTGSVITRSFNNFLTTPRQYLRKEIIATRNLYRKLVALDAKAGKGTITENVRQLLMFHVYMPVLFQYISSGLPGVLADWDEEDAEDLARAAIMGNLNGLFIVGGILQSFGDMVLDKSYAGKSPQTIGIINLAYGIMNKFYRASNIKDEEKRAQRMKEAYLELMTLVAVPAPQINRFIKNYNDIGTDNNIGKDILRFLNFSKYVIKGKTQDDNKKSTVSSFDILNNKKSTGNMLMGKRKKSTKDMLIGKRKKGK